MFNVENIFCTYIGYFIYVSLHARIVRKYNYKEIKRKLAKIIVNLRFEVVIKV